MTVEANADRVDTQPDAAELRGRGTVATGRRVLENSIAVRRQIARDLHDGAQQRLVNLLMGIRLSEELVNNGHPERASVLLASASREAQAAIDELRELVAGIHPSVLTSRGLLAAIESLAAKGRVPIVVEGSPGQRLPAPLEANVYFFVTEAVNSAEEHAGVSRITVSLASSPDSLSVIVSFKGAADALPADDELIGTLSDRVAAVDGELSVRSEPGSGTTLEARIPLPYTT